jgi:hypothetical protein
MKKTASKFILSTILIFALASVTHAHPGHGTPGHPENHENRGNFTIYPTYRHGDNTSWIVRDIQNGSTIKEFVTVENLTAEAQTVQLAVTSAHETDSSFNIDEESITGIGSWATLPQSSITLEPFASAKIPVEIAIPDNTPLEEFSGAVLASQTNSSNETLNIVTRIGVRMYLTVIPPQPFYTYFFVSPEFVNATFFSLSLFALLAAIFYTSLSIKDQRKYAKKQI